MRKRRGGGSRTTACSRAWPLGAGAVIALSVTARGMSAHLQNTLPECFETIGPAFSVDEIRIATCAAHGSQKKPFTLPLRVLGMSLATLCRSSSSSGRSA